MWLSNTLNVALLGTREYRGGRPGLAWFERPRHGIPPPEKGRATMRTMTPLESQRDRLLGLAERIVEILGQPWPRRYTAQVRNVWQLHTRSRLLLEHTAALIRRVDRREQ